MTDTAPGTRDAARTARERLDRVVESIKEDLEHTIDVLRADATVRISRAEMEYRRELAAIRPTAIDVERTEYGKHD